VSIKNLMNIKTLVSCSTST